MRTPSLVALLLLLGASFAPLAALAEDLPSPSAPMHEPKCPEEAEALPADLAAWATHDQKLTAAAAVDRSGEAAIVVGRAVDAELRPTPEIVFAARPANPGGSISRGGLFRLEIAKPGIYRVAVGARAWIDVVVAGKAVTSVAHGHGPACSGMRKVVDYDLPAGIHVLQLAASDATTTEVLVSAKQ